MNAIQFDQALTAHLVGWNPTLVVADSQPSATQGIHEFIRMTVLHGEGFIFESTGIFSVRGSTVMHSFLLRFDVFTKLNEGTQRSHELCQDVLDHWQVRDFGNNLSTLAGSLERVGEEPPRYHMGVLVEGRRLETL